MAVVCRIVCGEMLRPSRCGRLVAAVWMHSASRCVTFERVISVPPRFGNSGLPAAAPLNCRVQARSSAAVVRHSGTVRCLRPLPRRWTQGAPSRTKSPLAAEALRRIGELYAIEADIRGHPAELRQRVRHERSRPIVDALHAWLLQQVERVSAVSDLAKAMRYAIRHWPGLVAFLDDGRIEMDTNVVERAIRPSVLTRNYVQSRIMCSPVRRSCPGRGLVSRRAGCSARSCA